MGDVVTGLDIADDSQTIDWRLVAAAGYRFALFWLTPDAAVGRAEAPETGETSIGQLWRGRQGLGQQGLGQPWLGRQWQRAAEAGLLLSAIHRLDARVGAVDQAHAFLRRLDGHRPDLPLALCVSPEMPSAHRDNGVSDAADAAGDPAATLTPQPWAALITACSEAILRAGHRRPLILTDSASWDPHLPADRRWRQHDLWVEDRRAGLDSLVTPDPSNNTERPQDASGLSLTAPRLPRDWPAWRFWRFPAAERVPGMPLPGVRSRFVGTEAELLAYAEQPARAGQQGQHRNTPYIFSSRLTV